MDHPEVRELLDEGLLDPAAVVDGRVLIEDRSRRNRNLLVASPAGRFLVKRGPAGGEAAWYRRLRAIPALAPILPRPLGEPAAGRLVLEAERGAEDLWSHARRTGRVAPAIARALGSALGTLHRETRLAAPRPAPGDAHGVLRIHRPRVEALRELTAASVALVAVVQGSAPLVAGLRAARGAWRAECVVHGDIRWPNVLVVPGASAGPATVRLIDWEEAGEGDPAWDLGSALGAFLSGWISSIPPGPGDPARLAALARSPLAGMRPAAAALWDGYLEDRAEVGGDPARLLDRAMALAAARLVLAAYEMAQDEDALGAVPILHLQVAANVMARPGDAARRLLGLGPAP